MFAFEIDKSSFIKFTTLRLENVSNVVDSLVMVRVLPANSRVRLIGVNWSFTNYAEASAVYDILDGMRGLDENGNNLANAQVTGAVHITTIAYDDLATLQARYPDIAITYTNMAYKVEYRNYDNSLLYTTTVAKGGNAIDPVASGYITAPTRANTDDTQYSYSGWGTLPTNIQANTTVIANYNKTYRVRFYDNTTLLDTVWVNSGNNATYNGSTPTRATTAQYVYTFSGWSSSNGGSASSSILNNITTPKNVYAAFTTTTRQYTVRFYNGSTLLSTVTVNYGSTATYSGTPTSTDPDEVFTGWYPSNTNIQGDTDCYAVFSNPNALNGKSWAEISAISEAGTGANYFSVGDCKEVTLNGTVGTVEFTNASYYVYILGFNHNADIEGNGISFGTFKTSLSNGKNVCLVDSKYNNYSSDGTKYFNMNHSSNTNSGGWKGCDMRYDILGSVHAKNEQNAATTTATDPVDGTLMAALPADLRAVMKPITKYTDNYGNGSGTEARVTTTIDYLPLLSEFEIFGARSYANQYEQNKQEQYAYYAAGNSKVKYRHNANTSSAYWWERSAYYNSSAAFCAVDSSGGANGSYASNSYGVAPAFKV